MNVKTVSGRELRHGSPEETLSPGESVIVRKRDGKTFELRRVDEGRKSILAGLDRILREVPREGAAHPVDAARLIVEDRE